MQTSLAALIRATADGQRATAILRSCVHCGFCNATCPTYQLSGDELDGPRGRIYLIKQMLEGEPVSGRTRLHLDRCLTCRACETTCPSGVRYGELLEIGRAVIESQAPRAWHERGRRRALRMVLAYPRRFAPLLQLGRRLRPLLPAKLRARVPPLRPAGSRPARAQARRMLVLDGCVQGAIAPAINHAAARLLDSFGIRLDAAPQAGCCGALSLHLAAHAEARDFARRNIDAWWPALQQGAEAIVMTASGCGVTVRAYGDLLRDDPAYAARAREVAMRSRDLAQVIAAEVARQPLPEAPGAGRRVAFQSPCTLQHGQQIHALVEPLLVAAGYELAPVADAHLCCGSAGTYAILQPALAGQLRARKLDALQAGRPDFIATANIGCLTHLESAAAVPVRHWVELLAPPPPPVILHCSK